MSWEHYNKKERELRVGIAIFVTLTALAFLIIINVKQDSKYTEVQKENGKTCLALSDEWDAGTVTNSISNAYQCWKVCRKTGGKYDDKVYFYADFFLLHMHDENYSGTKLIVKEYGKVKE